MASDLLKEILRCSVVGMHVQHNGAQKGVLSFLESTIGYGLKLAETGGDTSSLEGAVVLTGEGIVSSICKGLMGEVTVFFVEGGTGSFAGILYKLNMLCGDLVKNWVGLALQADTTLVEMGAAKTQFMAIFGRVDGAAGAGQGQGQGGVMKKEVFVRKLINFHDCSYRHRKQLINKGH